MRYYDGKTHTDPFVTDPIRGGHDVLVEDIVRWVRRKDGGDGDEIALPAMPALLPSWLVDAARRVVPF